MATTDTRSGFRLPWSSDRSNDAQPADEAAEVAAETAETPETAEAAEAAEEPAADPIAWPSTDLNARLGLHSQPRPADAADVDAPPDAPPDAQEPEMINTEPAPPAPVAPRKPSKLMVDLSAAIRATAEAARDQALAQVDGDLAAVVELIRAGAKEGEDALRVRSDEDVAKIKDWSRAEIARIKEETEQRISARKLGLDEELAAHAAAIEQRVGEVETTVNAYRTDMEAYAERMGHEDDPAHLATMAETMPDPPELGAWADLGDLALDLTAATLATEEAEAAVHPGAVVETEAVAEPELIEAAAVLEAEVVAVPEVEAVVETEALADSVEPSEDAEADADAGAGPSGQGAAAWRDPDDAWAPPAQAAVTGDVADDAPVATAVATLEDDGSSEFTVNDDTPRWAGETPDGFPADATEGGDPVDRGAILAALEAAAEAVVAAESAAESADHAEAAADAAETAAELIRGRVDTDELDPDAAAAMSARVDAGGFEESYADRLASLLPSHADGAADGEPRTTRVIVSGLVSVASIASFKRHLGRLGGVTAVAVASGPEGEFVFNVTHRPDVAFRDAVPTMPGFAARVTGTGDGVVHVTARDPEAEG